MSGWDELCLKTAQKRTVISRNLKGGETAGLPPLQPTCIRPHTRMDACTCVHSQQSAPHPEPTRHVHGGVCTHTGPRVHPLRTPTCLGLLTCVWIHTHTHGPWACTDLHLQTHPEPRHPGRTHADESNSHYTHTRAEAWRPNHTRMHVYTPNPTPTNPGVQDAHTYAQNSGAQDVHMVTHKSPASQQTHVHRMQPFRTHIHRRTCMYAHVHMQVRDMCEHM